jgi:hypothetical protein
LGKSFDEVATCINGLKNREEERTLTVLHKNTGDNMDTDTGLSSLVVSNVSNLCEDLIEEDEVHTDWDVLLDNSTSIVKEKKTRQRKVYDLSNVRRSTRKRIIKKR